MLALIEAKNTTYKEMLAAVRAHVEALTDDEELQTIYAATLLAESNFFSSLSLAAGEAAAQASSKVA